MDTLPYGAEAKDVVNLAAIVVVDAQDRETRATEDSMTVAAEA